MTTVTVNARQFAYSIPDPQYKGTQWENEEIEVVRIEWHSGRWQVKSPILTSADYMGGWPKIQGADVMALEEAHKLAQSWIPFIQQILEALATLDELRKGIHGLHSAKVGFPDGPTIWLKRNQQAGIWEEDPDGL